jgi:hypothetical protein
MTVKTGVFVRVSRAWPVTIGLYVFQCLFAATFALPFVQSISVPGVLLRPQVAEWVGILRLVDGFDQGASRRALLPLALAALNYPWLSVAWLRALTEEEPFTEHARFALGRYRAAVGVAASVVVGLGVFAAASALAAHGVRAAFADGLDERALDLARLACFVPAVVGAVWLVTVQDAGYAAVSGNLRGWREIGRAALSGATVRLVGLRALMLLGQIVLTLAAWAIPRFTLGPGTAADFVVLVTTQSAAFVITCLRAVWLAYVLEAQRQP